MAKHALLPEAWQNCKIHHYDFTSNNKALSQIDPTDPEQLLAHTKQELKTTGAKLGIGQYAENRTIYKQEAYLTEKDPRTIHLGIDINLPAGTPLHLPLDGTVFALADHQTDGDYGPTVIIKHDDFYALFGHLSTSTITTLSIGQHIKAGEIFAYIGKTQENGKWPTHLHVQLIKDMGNHTDNYPGLCSVKDAGYYLSNCPDPASYAGLPFQN